MKKFSCANCGKFMTHGEWKKAGKLQQIREIMISSFDKDQRTLPKQYYKYCSSACESDDMFENHLPFFDMDDQATKEHLKKFHGMDFLDEEVI